MFATVSPPFTGRNTIISENECVRRFPLNKVQVAEDQHDNVASHIDSGESVAYCSS